MRLCHLLSGVVFFCAAVFTNVPAAQAGADFVPEVAISFVSNLSDGAGCCRGGETKGTEAPGTSCCGASCSSPSALDIPDKGGDPQFSFRWPDAAAGPRRILTRSPDPWPPKTSDLVV